MRIQPKLAVLACSGGRYTLSSHPTSTDNSIKPQGLTRVSFHIYLILTSENHWVFEQVPSLPCLRSDCFSASGKERNTCCTTEKQTFTYRSLFYSQTVWAGKHIKSVFAFWGKKRQIRRWVYCLYLTSLPCIYPLGILSERCLSNSTLVFLLALKFQEIRLFLL